MMHCWDTAIWSFFQNGCQPSSWIWSKQKWCHSIRHHWKPPPTKHEGDQVTHCRLMAIWSFSHTTGHRISETGHARDFIFCPRLLCSGLDRQKQQQVTECMAKLPSSMAALVGAILGLLMPCRGRHSRRVLAAQLLYAMYSNSPPYCFCHEQDELTKTTRPNRRMNSGGQRSKVKQSAKWPRPAARLLVPGCTAPAGRARLLARCWSYCDSEWV